MQTVLITGCSSGFGLDTAKLFLERGWKVVATMRTPDAGLLPASERLQVLALDVTDEASIRQAIEAAGPIDVLVNNAGIGVLAALEGTPVATAREVFETNTLGTIAMTQAVLPQFRAAPRRHHRQRHLDRHAGLAAAAVGVHGQQGGRECVHGIAGAGTPTLRHPRAPGAAGTRPFHPLRRQRAHTHGRRASPEPYAGVRAGRVRRHDASTRAGPACVVDARRSDVAEAVWRAANDPSCPLRQPAGADAVALSQTS
jgi:NAD(P)-dependent dehydrogenase (short-subunit alcohol dehydrogenase family)